MSNARKINNIDTNDMNFKRLETTKDIVLSPKNEYGDPQRPGATINGQRRCQTVSTMSAIFK